MGKGEAWAHHYIDDNGMTCEDLRVADLDEDSVFWQHCGGSGYPYAENLLSRHLNL
ncbi:MAG: hypothetical protein ACLFT3_02025 [Cyclobacteriaceae bacterium]